MNYIICFKIPVVWETLIFSRLHLNDLNIKYFNDKTVAFNNQIITDLLLLRT